MSWMCGSINNSLEKNIINTLALNFLNNYFEYGYYNDYHYFLRLFKFRCYFGLAVRN